MLILFSNDYSSRVWLYRKVMKGGCHKDETGGWGWNWVDGGGDDV